MNQLLDTSLDSKEQNNNSLARRALIIDDEESIRILLQEYLEIVGLQVDTAASGSEGLEYYHKNDYGLVICDVAMPGMDGFQVYERIYEMRPDQNFLFITGYSFEGAQKELIDRSLGLLRKPFHLNDLYKILSELFHDLENV